MNAYFQMATIHICWKPVVAGEKQMGRINFGRIRGRVGLDNSVINCNYKKTATIFVI